MFVPVAKPRCLETIHAILKAEFADRARFASFEKIVILALDSCKIFNELDDVVPAV